MTVRVLLNAAERELAAMGGDYRIYEDWRRLSGDRVRYSFVTPTAARVAHRLARTAVEKAVRRWQPAAVRRRLFAWSRLIRVPSADARGADAVLSHLLFPVFGAGPRPPVLWSSQGISPSRYYDYYNAGQWTVEDVAQIYRTLGRRAAALVISTHACARNTVRWCPELAEKIHVVPSAVFPTVVSETKPSCADGVIRILFVGVDAVRKGLPEAADAFAIVHARHPRLRFDVVSRPDAALTARLDALPGVTRRTSSAALDVKALMADADIFLLPTHADTYALAAVEALAHGCAVIVSDLEPLPEVAAAGEAGEAVPAGDVAAIAAALEGLVTDEPRLRTRQANARRRYREHHAAPVVQERLGRVLDAVAGRTEAVACTGRKSAR